MIQGLELYYQKVKGWWVVAHKILVTSPEAKFLFPFLGLWALDWDLASGLSILTTNERVG